MCEEFSKQDKKRAPAHAWRRITIQGWNQYWDWNYFFLQPHLNRLLEGKPHPDRKVMYFFHFNTDWAHLKWPSECACVYLSSPNTIRLENWGVEEKKSQILDPQGTHGKTQESHSTVLIMWWAELVPLRKTFTIALLLHTHLIMYQSLPKSGGGGNNALMSRSSC